MPDSLQAAVARAIMLAMNDHAHEEDIPYPHEVDAADAAIRVVLAEARRSIEALPAYGAPAQGAQRIDRAEALAVLAALGDEACSWCGRVGLHPSRCPNA